MSDCKFKRGQVWENPDGEFAMIISVENKGNGYKIYYRSEDGDIGSFYDTQKPYVDNISLVSQPSTVTPQKAREALDAIDRFYKDYYSDNFCEENELFEATKTIRRHLNERAGA